MSHCWAYTQTELGELLLDCGFEITGHFDCFMFKPDGRHDASGGVAECDDGSKVSISLNLQAEKG